MPVFSWRGQRSR